ncbi:MAG: ATP-dependent helicase [Candidatus Latescibacteria bacterium]|nr:ATP-dependent helicase [Candidatus Latescibacterota bacterium]
MSVNPWQELERELNARQREAVFSAAPHCLVLAGPGTGKTRTLVNRVVYLVSAAGVAPAQILTLTFTRKAARVMVERLARYLGESAGGVRTGTFHHFCLELLRRRAGHGEIPPDFSVADEPRQLRTLERAWNRLGVSARPPEERELRAMLGRFGAYRVARDPELLSGLQREFFAEYQRLLREERAIDFDDILDLARVLLESDAPLLAETRERWPRVLVDEFQDTDALQYRLLRLLAPPAASSFVVADDQQSIYAWRGADRRNVERYRADYAPHEVHLEENYRNREAILAGAQAVLGAGGEAGHTLVSRAGGEGSLRLEAFASEQEEADFLVADMRRARARDRHLRWGTSRSSTPSTASASTWRPGSWPSACPWSSWPGARCWPRNASAARWRCCVCCVTAATTRPSPRCSPRSWTRAPTPCSARWARERRLPCAPPSIACCAAGRCCANAAAPGSASRSVWPPRPGTTAPGSPPGTRPSPTASRSAPRWRARRPRPRRRPTRWRGDVTWRPGPNAWSTSRACPGCSRAWSHGLATCARGSPAAA